MGLSNIEDLLETGSEKPLKPMSRVEAILRGEDIKPLSRIEKLLTGYTPGPGPGPSGGGSSVLSTVSFFEISGFAPTVTSGREYPNIPVLYEGGNN